MKAFMVLISSPPSSQEFLTALNLSLALRKQGEPVSLCLLQDAVLGALSRNGAEGGSSLQEAVEKGIRCYVLDEDLAMRGYGNGDLPGYMQVISYSGLVGLLLEGESQIIGCF